MQEAVSMPPATEPRVETEDLEFLDLLIIVAQRKRLVALMTALGTLVAMAIALALTPEYTATVVLLPPRAFAPVISALTDDSDSKDSANGKERKKVEPAGDLNEMYVSILRSRPVEEAVIQRYALMAEYHKGYMADARKALESHAKIDGSTRDGLIRLNFSDRDPSRAAEIANGYVEQFKAVTEHLVMPVAVGQSAVMQIVEPAVPPETKSFPNRALMTLAGTVVGLTFGIMLALLGGGLVRLQSDHVTRRKLELLLGLVASRRGSKRIESGNMSRCQARPETTPV
jgi:uncharacterized protein involved in exopolysaccharide biosynthesis